MSNSSKLSTGTQPPDHPATGGGLENAVFHALQQPVIVCDENNRVTFANYAAQNFFGASRQVLLRQMLDKIIAFGSPILELVEAVRQGNVPMTKYRVVAGPMRSSHESKVDVFASPLPEFPGSVSLLFQQRTMADKIDRQLVSQGAVRSATGLAAMLAHEIKNPLSGIRGAAQLLEQTIAEDEKLLARLIRDETDRIVKLIDRVEIFGDQRPVERRALNVHVALDRVKLLAQSGIARTASIVENYDPSLPDVFGNEDQLIQVFINLIKNAAEAIENTDKPTITISTKFVPGVKISVSGTSERISLPLEITIQDNGPGIPEEILPIMFEPFVTGKSGGTGLGLALVAKMVADHGGIIECDSQPGRTRFRILLPMAPSKTLPLPTKTSPLKATSNPKATT
ncbi:MAG TPA: PAS domain-containing protein [Devosia sp.]|nr:PAS domain-containing protein [Devosia sp.]